MTMPTGGPHTHGFIHFRSGYIVVPSGGGTVDAKTSMKTQGLSCPKLDSLQEMPMDPARPSTLVATPLHGDMADDLYATVADLQDGCVLSAREKAQFVLAGFVKALR